MSAALQGYEVDIDKKYIRFTMQDGINNADELSFETSVKSLVSGGLGRFLIFDGVGDPADVGAKVQLEQNSYAGKPVTKGRMLLEDGFGSGSKQLGFDGYLGSSTA